MKLRTVCTTVAIALAACAVSPSLSVADDAAPAEQQNLPLVDQVAELRADIAEGKSSCVQLHARVETIVAQIDDLLDAGSDNKADLLKLRKYVLGLRTYIQCDEGHDHANGTTLTVDGGGALGAAGSTLVGTDGGHVVPMGHSHQGPIFNAGRGAGGGTGGGSGLSFGSIGTLGAMGEAIAIPVAVSGDDDDPGLPESPSS